jgi:parallel beta-helix repeat protein
VVGAQSGSHFVAVDDIRVTNSGSGLAALFNGGNVGIGTSFPGRTLEVNGDALYKTTTNTTDAFTIQNASNLALFNADTTNNKITLGAGTSLTITGDTSTNITGYSSPSTGAITYDTTNKQLLIYANGKWQADRSDAVLVAASNSSQADKNAADYVANGDTGAAADGDQVQINQALTAASGKKVVLLAGTYTVDAAISVPNNTTLSGVGAGTKLTIPNSFNAAIKVITNADTTTGTGITISNMSLDGNVANNTSGLENGIYLDGVGDSTTNRQGGTVQNIQVSNFRSVGISLQNSDGNTVTNNRAKNNNYNIDVESSYQNTITANTTASGTWGVYVYGGGENTVSGNTAEKSTNGNIRIDTTKGTSVTGNTATAGNYAGISVYNSTDVTVTGNTVEDNVGAGIEVGWTNTSIFASNRILNSGNTTNNKGIYVYSSDSNQITNNKITDSSCTTTCYAIDITDSASDKNSISGNTFVGDGTYTASLHDLGTGTILSGQATSENGQDIRYKQTASTTALSVQNASGVGVLTVDTTNGLLQVGNYNGGVNAVNGKIAFGNTTNANTVSIQSGATFSSYSITLPSSLGASGSCLVDTTGTGVLGFSSCGGGGGGVSSINTQTGAITIQGTTNQIAVNTTGGTLTLSTPQDINTTSGVTFGSLVVGSGGNTITLNGSGYVATGTYRHSKTVTLMAEYANTVLDNGGTGNNTGTMTTALDLTNRMNYYKWTTTSGTNQTYDVVIQVPIPSDFDGWGSNPLSISAYTTDTTNGTITLEARDTAGSVQCNFVNVTPGSTSTWAANNTACTLAVGTYTAGGYMTLRVRMQSGNAGDTRIGNIVLNYKSKF